MLLVFARRDPMDTDLLRNLALHLISRCRLSCLFEDGWRSVDYARARDLLFHFFHTP